MCRVTHKQLTVSTPTHAAHQKETISRLRTSHLSLRFFPRVCVGQPHTQQREMRTKSVSADSAYTHTSIQSCVGGCRHGLINHTGVCLSISPFSAHLCHHTATPKHQHQTCADTLTSPSRVGDAHKRKRQPSPQTHDRERGPSTRHTHRRTDEQQ